MLLQKNFFGFANTPKIYGGLNISSIKFSLVTPKTAKSAKKFPFEIFKLYGIYRQL